MPKNSSRKNTNVPVEVSEQEVFRYTPKITKDISVRKSLGTSAVDSRSIRAAQALGVLSQGIEDLGKTAGTIRQIHNQRIERLEQEQQREDELDAKLFISQTRLYANQFLQTEFIDKLNSDPDLSPDELKVKWEEYLNKGFSKRSKYFKNQALPALTAIDGDLWTKVNSIWKERVDVERLEKASVAFRDTVQATLANATGYTDIQDVLKSEADVIKFQTTVRENREKIAKTLRQSLSEMQQTLNTIDKNRVSNVFVEQLSYIANFGIPELFDVVTIPDSSGVSLLEAAGAKGSVFSERLLGYQKEAQNAAVFLRSKGESAEAEQFKREQSRVLKMLNHQLNDIARYMRSDDRVGRDAEIRKYRAMQELAFANRYIDAPLYRTYSGILDEVLTPGAVSDDPHTLDMIRQLRVRGMLTPEYMLGLQKFLTKGTFTPILNEAIDYDRARVFRYNAAKAEATKADLMADLLSEINKDLVLSRVLRGRVGNIIKQMQGEFDVLYENWNADTNYQEGRPLQTVPPALLSEWKDKLLRQFKLQIHIYASDVN